MENLIGLLILFIPFLGYFIGSIPFGVLIAKEFGHTDIRQKGSKNIGATNVLRVTNNKLLASLTLALDASKAALVIAIFYALLLSDETVILESGIIFAIVGFGAVLGHCYPVWLKFKGGKGVATTLGAFLAACPPFGAVCCITWLISALIFRISSLAALITMLLAPVYAYFFYPIVFCLGEKNEIDCFLFHVTSLWTQPLFYSLLIVPFTLLIFWRHKDNIKRLMAGTEPKIGAKKDKDEPAPEAE